MAYHSKVEDQIIQIKIVSCLINYKKVKTNRISSSNKKKFSSMIPVLSAISSVI
jgi:hypothetical protein